MDFFREALEPYIDFNESCDIISSNRKTDGTYHVYLTDIKSEFLTLAPAHSSIILKELSQKQAEIYRKVSAVWNPHLETVYGVLEKDGHYLSVSEFIQAPQYLNYEYRSINLEDYIREFGCFSEKDALLLLCQLCDGVEALRKINLTHGDISPQNILLTDASPWNPAIAGSSKRHAVQRDITQYLSVKIIDFDISKEKKKSDHEVTTIVGTSSFAAPEIIDYRYPSDRVDIYSLGCILHYMITGKSPKDSDMKISRNQISRGTFRIIKHCTAAYEMRYKNAAKLKQAILHEMRCPTNPLLTVLYRIPGFRTRRIWKMAVALYFYSAFFLTLIPPLLYGKSPGLDETGFCLCFIIEVIFVCDVFHLGDLSMKYTYLAAKYPPIRYLVKFLILIALLVLYFIIYVFLL